MKKGWIKKIIILVVVLLVMVPSILADNVTFNKDMEEAINQINSIRKQFVEISKNGYVNHNKSQSNQEQISLTKVYLDQISSIKKNLEEYNKDDLDKFSIRTIKVLITVATYLQEMGEDLIEYLTASDLQEQFKLFAIFVQTNSEILNILANVKGQTLG